MSTGETAQGPNELVSTAERGTAQRCKRKITDDHKTRRAARNEPAPVLGCRAQAAKQTIARQAQQLARQSDTHTAAGPLTSVRRLLRLAEALEALWLLSLPLLLLLPSSSASSPLPLSDGSVDSSSLNVLSVS